jgi:hypothetical protein
MRAGDGKARGRGEEGSHAITPSLNPCSPELVLTPRHAPGTKMDGKGSRPEVEVERAETDGGEEKNVGEGESALSLKKMEGERNLN